MQTVLILEDDVSILTLIRMIVEQSGYNVLLATSAEEAFEQFEANDGQVDLLIADVTLPLRSGIHVAGELRSLVPYLKIIITSGLPLAHWNEQDAAELDELPCDSFVFLQKPFAAATLLGNVHRLIGLPFVATPAFQVKTASQQ